jgi:UDP-glucose 4-epimerase
MRRACITGGAGFIGSTLAERLSARGVEVVIMDNFTTGKREFISDLLARPGTTLIKGDVLDHRALERAVEGCDWVFHLQANADVRGGLQTPRRDLEQNTIATSNVLEAMRAKGVNRIVFASTGSVYGEPDVFPTPEDAPFPIQTSLYAASKLAGEGLIGAYATGYGFTGLICRFVSILGERYTHGHVLDFYRALKRDPTSLRVLGDGRQEKSYLYVQDCVTAILTAVAHHDEQPGVHHDEQPGAHNEEQAGAHHDEQPGAHIYNLGTEETVIVDQSIATITEYMGVEPSIEYTGGRRGWPGDSPLIHLDTTRIRSLGWTPKLSIKDAIVRTLDWFERNEHVWREPSAHAAMTGVDGV